MCGNYKMTLKVHCDIGNSLSFNIFLLEVPLLFTLPFNKDGISVIKKVNQYFITDIIRKFSDKKLIIKY